MESYDPMSPNQILVEFSIAGQAEYGRGIFDYNFAPRTIALINYHLRNSIQTRIVVREGEVNFPFKIGRAGPENAKKQVKEGDIGYWSQSNVLIVFLVNKLVSYPVNIVGYIERDSIHFFKNLKIGRSIKLERVKGPIDEEDYL
jgi:hypothetical protein